jgi:hypothetical protein
MSAVRHAPFRTITDGLVIEFQCGARAWVREQDRFQNPAMPLCVKCKAKLDEMAALTVTPMLQRVAAERK